MHCEAKAALPDFSIIFGKYSIGGLSLIWRFVRPVRPYGEGGAHEASNGLLLRRDIHSLFDAGYVTVTPDLRFEVSRRIREEFENGRVYYDLHGGMVRAARRKDWAVAPEFL